MASKFQSRLVGTIILSAIGIIFLPDILDGEKVHFKEEFAAIPIKPNDGSDEVESFEILEPIEDNISFPESPVEMVIKDGEAVSSDRVETQQMEVPERNEYQDSGWIIQLMALKNTDNANAVVKDLQKRGYQAHVIQEKEFSRVIVGPDVSKTKLETQLKELDKILGTNGQIQQFKPINP